MRRKLYFLLPDSRCARLMMDELLLARVDASSIHFYAERDVKLGDLPRADTSEKSEMMFGGVAGLVLGAFLGFCAGVLALMFPPWYVPASKSTILLITTIFGAVTASGWTAVVAAVLPNSTLRKYKAELAKGMVLMIVKVPFQRSKELRDMINKRHPEAGYNGTWPMDHDVFP